MRATAGLTLRLGEHCSRASVRATSGYDPNAQPLREPFTSHLNEPHKKLRFSPKNALFSKKP